MSEIQRCLQRALRRDSAEGGYGWRDTREVADWVGMPMARARDHLERLYEAGEIEAAMNGRVYVWRAKRQEGASR